MENKEFYTSNKKYFIKIIRNVDYNEVKFNFYKLNEINNTIKPIFKYHINKCVGLIGMMYFTHMLLDDSNKFEDNSEIIKEIGIGDIGEDTGHIAIDYNDSDNDCPMIDFYLNTSSFEEFRSSFHINSIEDYNFITESIKEGLYSLFKDEFNTYDKEFDEYSEGSEEDDDGDED